MDTLQAMPSKRRYRSRAEKIRIVQESMAEGVSIAAVARQHGVNANLLFNWRRLYQQGLLEKSREPTAAKLLPVQIAPALPSPVERQPPGGHIQVSLPGGIVVDVAGPSMRRFLLPYCARSARDDHRTLRHACVAGGRRHRHAQGF
jgi:transposase